MTDNEHPTALIVGASRGLGLAMVAEFLRRDWRVIATVRGENRTQLDDLDAHGRLEVETLDITVPEQIAAGYFPSDREMKAEAVKYLLDVAREEARELPCCLSLVVRDEKGGISSLVLSITDAKAN